MTELFGPAAGEQAADASGHRRRQGAHHPLEQRLPQAGGELVEEGGVGFQVGQDRPGVDGLGAERVGDEDGPDGGQSKARGDEERVHQMSIFTMRMMIPTPMPTDTAAPMSANRPG